MIRLRKLLQMNGQELYDAGRGPDDWNLSMFLAQSRSYMRHLPAWRFWPLALIKYPGFRQLQAQDREKKVAHDAAQ